MTTEFYSTPAAVIARTGVEPGDLGMASSDDLNSWLEDLLSECRDLIDLTTHRNYGDQLDAGEIERIPRGLEGVAADMAASGVTNALVTRQSPTVRIDDLAVKVIAARLLTPDVKERLKVYTKSVGSIDLGHGDLAAEGGPEDLTGEWPIV